MSSWRVAQHYGFGAARIPIHPEPHHAAPSSLAAGFRDLRSEFVEGGPAAMLGRVVAQSPAIGLCALLLIAFFNTVVLRDYSDRSPIEIVLFDSATEPLPVIPEVIPEPQPEPIPVAIEPPAPRAEILPPPPPIEIVAERPKPPPAPPPLAKAKPRPKPKAPEMPKLARVEKSPPPVARPNRAPRVQPLPASRPKVGVDAVAPKVEPLRANAPGRLERIAKVARPTPTVAPKLDAPAAPQFDAPSEAPPRRSFRVAAKTGAARVRTPDVMPGVAPPPQSPAAPVATPQRGARPAPTPRPRRTPGPSARSLSTPTASSAERPPPPMIAPPRVTRGETPRAPRGTPETRPGLAGVPLAELAVCLTDRDEDRLKQAVLAAVTTQKECVSPAGTYRFVETKNLNSFLMWIDRASGRAIGDRCAELRNALECLEGASQRAAR